MHKQIKATTLKDQLTKAGILDEFIKMVDNK
jgi:hypothetical protein